MTAWCPFSSGIWNLHRTRSYIALVRQQSTFLWTWRINMLLGDNREYPQPKGFRITILQFLNISGKWNFPSVVNDSPEISITSDLRIQVQL